MFQRHHLEQRKAAQYRDQQAKAMVMADGYLRRQMAFLNALHESGKMDFEVSDPITLVAQAHFLHALFAEYGKKERLPGTISYLETADLLLVAYLARAEIAPGAACSVMLMVNRNMICGSLTYSLMEDAALAVLRDGERVHFAAGLATIMHRGADGDLIIPPHLTVTAEEAESIDPGGIWHAIKRCQIGEYQGCFDTIHAAIDLERRRDGTRPFTEDEGDKITAVVERYADTYGLLFLYIETMVELYVDADPLLRRICRPHWVKTVAIHRQRPESSFHRSDFFPDPGATMASVKQRFFS